LEGEKIIMRITQVRRIVAYASASPMQSGSSSGKKEAGKHINMPIVFITTEDGTKARYAWSLLGGATATAVCFRTILRF